MEAKKEDVKLEIYKQRDYAVVKANEIIQKARYDLEITELKLFAYVVSKIKPTDKENQYYQIKIKEYCQVCGIDYENGGNYDYIKKKLKQLRDKSFWLMKEDGSEVTVGWFDKVIFRKQSGTISIRLDEDIQKYVIGIYDNYTQYSLLSILPMKSNYSIRIYELLESYAFQKQHKFEIDDLKSRLFCTNYVNFKDFRKKVLEVAVKEINLYTDLEVAWEPVLKGKKVTHVIFQIKRKEHIEKIATQYKAIDALEGQLTLEDYYR